MSRFIEELREELRGHTGAAITGIVLMAAGIISWVLGNHILEPLVDEDVYLGLVIMTCGPMLVTFGGMLCLMLLTTLAEERRDDPHQHLAEISDVQDLDDRAQQRDQYDRIGDGPANHLHPLFLPFNHCENRPRKRSALMHVYPTLLGEFSEN